MTEKVYKEVLPYGILTTRSGNKFWLLRPNPIVRDSWQHDRQQRFLVVPYKEITYSGNTLLYSYARHLITTDPDIEYIYAIHPIEVQELQEQEIDDEALEYLDKFEQVEALIGA